VNTVRDRSNNFDAIRLLGAVMVLVGHTYPIAGRPYSPPLWGGSIQTAGLVLFFSLSGYLIYRSWSFDSRLLPYLAKRSLRIFPALVVVVLVSMFVLGPLLTRLSITEYASNIHLWEYLKNIVLSPVYALPGVFETNPIPNAVNGSLWSLPAEFACYLMVPVVALLPKVSRGPTFFVLALGSGILSEWMSAGSIRIVIWGTDLAQATSVWPYFLMGAAIASAGAWLSLRVDVGFIALLGATILAGVIPQFASIPYWIGLPYAIIAFGSSSTPVVKRAGRFGDFSYGIYLWAFPIQQTVVFLWPNQTVPLIVAITTVAAVGLAFLSWHLIEKPALSFKRFVEPRVVLPRGSSAT